MTQTISPKSKTCLRERVRYTTRVALRSKNPVVRVWGGARCEQSVFLVRRWPGELCCVRQPLRPMAERGPRAFGQQVLALHSAATPPLARSSVSHRTRKARISFCVGGKESEPVRWWGHRTVTGGQTQTERKTGDWSTCSRLVTTPRERSLRPENGHYAPSMVTAPQEWSLCPENGH